jgi:hypothetical protein
MINKKNTAMQENERYLDQMQDWSLILAKIENEDKRLKLIEIAKILSNIEIILYDNVLKFLKNTITSNE